MSNQAIIRARKAFKDWRSQRENPKAPTPDRLRKMALALCALRGEESARAELGLSSSQIWEWKRALSKQSVRARRRPSRRGKIYDVSDAQPPKFVDVTPKPSQLGHGSISVEWSRADGSKMKLTGLAVQDTAELAAQFLAGKVNQDCKP